MLGPGDSGGCHSGARGGLGRAPQLLQTQSQAGRDQGGEISQPPSSPALQAAAIAHLVSRLRGTAEGEGSRGYRGARRRCPAGGAIPRLLLPSLQQPAGSILRSTFYTRGSGGFGDVQ